MKRTRETKRPPSTPEPYRIEVEGELFPDQEALVDLLAEVLAGLGGNFYLEDTTCNDK